MGPFRMADMVGLDLGIQAAKKAGRFHPETNIKDALIASGRLGQKNGKGYYDYADGRTPSPSAEVAAILQKVANANAAKAKQGVGARSFTDEELVNRMFFPLVNEGFKVLEEGYAARPSDIDVCYVHGYGFPRYRGGPMHYADKVGLPLVLSTLEEMGVTPAGLLRQCVAANQTLAKFWESPPAQKYLGGVRARSSSKL